MNNVPLCINKRASIIAMQIVVKSSIVTLKVDRRHAFTTLARFAERISCIELGSRRRIFKSGISSGSPDPEIGVSCRSVLSVRSVNAAGAIGTAKEAPECERATPADRRRTRGGRSSGDERRAKEDERERGFVIRSMQFLPAAHGDYR